MKFSTTNNFFRSSIGKGRPWQSRAPLGGAVVLSMLFVVATGLGMFTAPQKADAAVFTIASSTRFISGTPSYLRKTLTTPTDNKKWTYSVWVKRSKLDYEAAMLLDAYTNSSNYGYIGFRYAATPGYNTLEWYDPSGGYLTSTPVYRDPSKWYHVVVAYDTTQSTAANRVKFYVDGTQVTAFNRSSYPSLNYASGMINSAVSHDVGLWQYDNSAFDGYMSEVYFVDGQALDPTYFGATDANGFWRPKNYTGTYGTNGFHLPLMGTSTAAGIGIDTSGNNNTWTVNNIATTDFVKDSPTNSFATLNPVAQGSLTYPTTVTLGSLKQSNSSGGFGGNMSTMGVTSGKYYAEVKDTAGTGGVERYGVLSSNNNQNPEFSTGSEWGPGSWGTQGSSAVSYLGLNALDHNGARTSSWASSYTSGDIMSVAFDANTGKVWFAKNGVWQASGNPALGTSPASTLTKLGAFHFFGALANSAAFEWNFGQGGQSGLTYYSAAGGYFKYEPPAGYKALSTNNLPTPPIQKPKNYFDAVTYTGNGGTKSVTGISFQPDLVIVKDRTSTNNWGWFDDIRGVTKYISSNSITAQTTDANSLTSFDSGGFTLGSTAAFNTNSNNYVAYAFKEGTTPGFDIVTWTGDGTSARVISHDLGATPTMIIQKAASDGTYGWNSWHTGLSTNYYISLNYTSAQDNSVNPWPRAGITSSYFTTGSDAVKYNNLSATTHVAYLFTDIEGFSKFGSYTGNGSTDGPFIYTGFKPRLVLAKRTDAAGSWYVYDTARRTYNLNDAVLNPNLSDAEGNFNGFDILSNGFKPRTTGGDSNASGSTYIYAAFAEQPFKLSAMPGTAAETTSRKIRLWGGIRLLGGIRLW